MGKNSPSVDDLSARIRDAHTGVATAFSNAIDRAIDAGEALILAKKSKLIPHGQWREFLRRCGVGERQAERYMRLAGLVAANPTWKSYLAELSIEQAIKLLSPRKPSKTTSTGERRRSIASRIARSLRARTSPLPGSAHCRASGRERSMRSGLHLC